MFLVEIEAGREALYESVNAFVTAIRRGEVGSQSRIFHRASSSWISITLHPEFRKATAARGSEPLPPLARNRWTFYGLEPKGREIYQPPAAQSTVPQTSARPSGRPGWRDLLARAVRGLIPSQKTPETSGS